MIVAPDQVNQTDTERDRETATQIVIKLNYFADLSNDEEEEDEEPSSSLALSYCAPQPSLASSTSSIKKQRSLTPDRDIETDTGPSHLNLKKQRSLTPERRAMSLTPEERRRIMTKQQVAMNLARNSGVAMERQKRFEGKLLAASSRSSSSSSSYSGDEMRHRRGPVQSSRHQQPYRVSSNNVTSSNNSLDSGDHRIRRSK